MSRLTDADRMMIAYMDRCRNVCRIIGVRLYGSNGPNTGFTHISNSGGATADVSHDAMVCIEALFGLVGSANGEIVDMLQEPDRD